MFAGRLAECGVDEAGASALFGRARLSADRDLPDWAETFAEMFADAAEPAGAARDDSADNQPLPFEHLLRPIAAAARRMLEEGAGAALHDLLSDAALADLERSLLARIAHLCTPGLFGDFRLFRHLWQARRGGLPFAAPGSRRIYDAYVDAWRNGRCRTFFLAQPVAARLVGVAASQWIARSREFAERLRGDYPEFAEFLSSGTAPGTVASLSAGLSDPHRDGRQVAILTFASGDRIVYKPKDLRIDAGWARLLEWLEEGDAPVRFRHAAVLVRDGYGWARYVSDEDEAYEAATDFPAYYRRAGGLLALLHLLCAADFHRANVLASGGFPVPIDLETLLHPKLAGLGEAEVGAAAKLASALLENSVAATLYLPAWMAFPGGRLLAAGGLDQRWYEDEDSGYRHVNSDDMQTGAAVPAERPAKLFTTARFAQHLDDFVAGFAALYGFLEKHRAALLEPGGPLESFRGVEVRAVLRPTALYDMIQRRARGNANLSNGAAWSLYFDYLRRGDPTGEPSTQLLALRAAERTAAARCDIPMFTAATDAGWLEANRGERIENCLPVVPFDRLIERVHSLGDDDRVLQERIIRSTVATRRIGADQRAPTDGCAPLDPVGEAVRIGEALEQWAIRSGDDLAWIGLHALNHDHSVVSRLDTGLYSGATGVSLFLAALARTSGEERFRDLALAAAAPALTFLSSDFPAPVARQIGIGAGSGLGSLVYGLVLLADLLNESEILGHARSAASLIDAGLIAADTSLDVMNGSAGAILGLLALHHVSGDAAALERATACGRHLLQSRSRDKDGHIGWRTLAAEPHHQTGIAHGAAGIALALLRLHRATGEADFHAAAIEALDCERRLFVPLSGNWPDMRAAAGANGTPLPCQWCYGAPGIGLARLACLDLIGDDSLEREIAVALDTTLMSAPLSVDDLCCGNFGRIDFLLTSGARLARPELVAAANDRAAEAVRSAKARGEFLWKYSDDAMNPSLFKGIAGIGYELLRLADAANLPSVLSWDISGAGVRPTYSGEIE